MTMSPEVASPEMQEIVIVTGASSGIGEATARELARRGFQTMLPDRLLDRILAAALRRHFPKREQRMTFARHEAGLRGTSIETIDLDPVRNGKSSWVA